jgi:hypothetical protein
LSRALPTVRRIDTYIEFGFVSHISKLRRTHQIGHPRAFSDIGAAAAPPPNPAAYELVKERRHLMQKRCAQWQIRRNPRSGNAIPRSPDAMFLTNRSIFPFERVARCARWRSA